MDAVEMKQPLFLTAAIAVREAESCISDAGRICDELNETDDARYLRSVAEGLAPIAERLKARSQSESSGT